ncbi:MAG: DUF4954 family protein [Bacteroidales bacterium]|nr:DUF4954 family protein [Bacteroidales bacterium]
MSQIVKHPIQTLGYQFIPEEFLPVGKDEYYLRNKQNTSNTKYRQLTAHEIEILVRNHNTSGDWNKLLVSDAFNPELVKDCKFFGLVRIGKLEPYFLEFHDLKVPVGLYSSTIINCDFGDNVVVDNVNYFANYITGDEVIIVNVNEIATSNHAKFGNGILKEGESEEIRIWLEICNENGGRSVMPFEGMLPGDAWLWSRSRHDQDLQRRFREMTEKKFDNFRGYYGTLGHRTVIKNCSIVKDVKTGTDAYLKGANKLKNLTINSSEDAPTQIGEGCELVNGVIGLGCRIFYGVKAVRFILGANSQLKYGARLINSYLGDNATISCCEVLNSLIFPAHEQHHNNSFLIAATIEGQSNIAAGATIGSNHNSRGADGELVAARGFWPALCSSIKHNSSFAPFTLLAKADYPAELNITLPFSLVSRDEANNHLTIMPAYWFMYNMYALARNAWKMGDRDKRPEKIQFLETAYLAPDTVNSMFEAIRTLELMAGKHLAELQGQSGQLNDAELRAKGKQGLDAKLPELASIPDKSHMFEHSSSPAVIVKASEACATYREMIMIYAVEALLNHKKYHPDYSFKQLADDFKTAEKREEYVNVGGQLMKISSLQLLRSRISSYEIIDWEAVYQFYHTEADQYTADKFKHAITSLKEVLPDASDKASFSKIIGNYLIVKQKYAKSIEDSRKKDYSNPFRKMVYENAEEMDAVIGKLGKNSFIRLQKQELEKFSEEAKALASSWSLDPS